MLGRCYKAEMSKILKSKGIYIALGVVVLFVVLFGLMTSFMGDMSIPSLEEPMWESIKELPREMYDDTIKGLENQLDTLDKSKNPAIGHMIDVKADIKTRLAILKYLKAHEDVDISELDVPSMNNAFVGNEPYSFLITIIGIVTEIVIFYAVISMSNTLSTEYRDGTLKMELLRPNKRSSLYTAKWLATFTTSVVLLIAGLIASALYTAIAFKPKSAEFICIVNNTHVFLMNSAVFVLLEAMMSLVSIFAMIQFSSFMCHISRFGKASSMAIPIIVLLFGSTTVYLMQVAYIGMLDFVHSLDYLAFIMPMGNMIPNASLYTAIPVSLAYITLFTWVSYARFDRLEL